MAGLGTIASAARGKRCVHVGEPVATVSVEVDGEPAVR
jgi:hypothetical protein